MREPRNTQNTRKNGEVESGGVWSGGVDFNAEAQRRGGWEVRYGKSIFTENKRKNKMLENKTILSLSYGKIIVKSSPDSGLVPAEYSGYQILSPGDIVIRCTDLQNDQKSQRIGFVEVGGIITSAYLGLKVNDGINSRYIAYWLKNWDATKEIYRYGSGLRQSLSWVDLKYLPIPLPPLSEQEAIVKYLDAETGRIDKAIAAEEKMVALLQERREIVINEAVSGSGKCGSEGVDFNAEAQSRRVRRGWEVRPLRAFLRPVSVRNRPDEQLLSVTRETGVIVRDVTSKEENHNYIPDDLSCYKFVVKGQFVINKMKAWQGSYGVSPYDGIVSPAYFVYDLNFSCKEFFNIALRSKFYVPYFQRYSKGIRIDQWDLMPEALKLMPFAYPPLAEQEEIVKYLDAETGTIDRAIEVKRRQIELLRERRQIVIDEAVTGKVRVA